MQREVRDDPSFSTDVQEIIERKGCSAGGCHRFGQAGLILGTDPAENYENLVGVPAESEDFLRVKPFDPDSSYVVIKVEGRQAEGDRMPPLSVDALDSIDLANVRNWIMNGARNN